MPLFGGVGELGRCVLRIVRRARKHLGSWVVPHTVPRLWHVFRYAGKMHARDRFGRSTGSPPSRGIMKRNPGREGSSVLRAMPCQNALRKPEHKSLSQRADERLVGRRVQCPSNITADIETAMLGVSSASEGVVIAAVNGRCCVRFDDGTLEAFSHRGQEQWHPASSVRRWLMPAVDSLSDALGAMSTTTTTAIERRASEELSAALDALATTASAPVNDAMVSAMEHQLSGLRSVSADELADMSDVQSTLGGLSIKLDRHGRSRRAGVHVTPPFAWSPPPPPTPQSRPPRPPPPRPAPPPTPPPALPMGEAFVLPQLRQSMELLQPVPLVVPPPRPFNAAQHPDYETYQRLAEARKIALPLPGPD